MAQSSAHRPGMADLKKELVGRLFRDVPGYHAKYFPDIIATSSQLESTTSVRLEAPEIATRSPGLLAKSCSNLLELIQIYSSKTLPSPNTFIFQSGAEIVLVTNAVAQSNKTALDTEILVLGVIQEETDALSDYGILSFCKRAIAVFTAHPHRIFLHAFRFYGSSLETWTFDRAGAYCGRVVDLRSQTAVFRRILAGYLSMDNLRLGLNPLIGSEKQKHFVEIERHGRIERYYISTEAFVTQEDFIGPGTSCFTASDTSFSGRKFVVKFTWSQDGISSEHEMLQIVKDRNIQGVIGLESYQHICTIKDTRQGLTLGQPYFFSPPQDDDRHLLQVSIQNTPNNFSPVPRPGVPDEASVFEDLKLECIITSPLGQPLDTFRTPQELCLVLHDVIKALRSLYLEASIIHRDISTQNIIIVPKAGQNIHESEGILIDLNLALDLSHPPEREDLAGSEGFMAIGLLGGDKASYRHDLESVFYVFLWLAICHDGSTSQHIPDKSRLHAWCGTDWLASFHQKRKDMHPVEFPIWIKKEFSESFRPFLPLAEELHGILFPSKNDKIFIGTHFDPAATARLYEDMIRAFRDASAA